MIVYFHGSQHIIIWIKLCYRGIYRRPRRPATVGMLNYHGDWVKLFHRGIYRRPRRPATVGMVYYHGDRDIMDINLCYCIYNPRKQPATVGMHIKLSTV